MIHQYPCKGGVYRQINQLANASQDEQNDKYLRMFIENAILGRKNN